MESFLDPTFVYMVLMIGLWLGVTSVFIPGTGIPEFGAIAIIGGAMVALSLMATNWFGVVLVVAATALFAVIPLVRPRYARYVEFALVFQAVGSVFLFRDTLPNPLVIAAVLVLAFAYNRFLLVPMMERLRALPEVGNEIDDLLGAEGRVVAPAKALQTGTAQINGELWTVRSEHELERGDIVRVVSTHGLEAQVDRVKRKRLPDEKIHVKRRKNGTKPEKSLQ